jgi:hypothetical protein
MHSVRALFLSLALLGCRNASPPGPTDKPLSGSARTPVLDTLTAYRMAIADYIRAMDTSAAPLNDKVYIGRHAEFPHIGLSEVIAGRHVQVVDPEFGEREKHRARFSYLNIFSAWTASEVEFYVVRFAQYFRHRPDGSDDRHLLYRPNTQGEWALHSVSR